MSHGLTLNSTAGVVMSVDANTTFLDGAGLVMLTGMTPDGTHTIAGYNSNTHDIFVTLAGGFLPIWWMSGNVFNWRSFNGHVSALNIHVMRRTYV